MARAESTLSEEKVAPQRVEIFAALEQSSFPRCPRVMHTFELEFLLKEKGVAHLSPAACSRPMLQKSVHVNGG